MLLNTESEAQLWYHHSFYSQDTNTSVEYACLCTPAMALFCDNNHSQPCKWFLPKLHLVPVRLSKMYWGSSSSCFQGCGQARRVLHLWRTCPKVRRFWLCVHSLIHSVTLVNITKDSRIARLNEPVENIPWHTHTLIYFMFLMAKISATSWKSPVVD